jgi:hypothetical protein
VTPPWRSPPGPGEGLPAAILAATAAGIHWYGRRRGKVRRQREA